MNSTDKLSEQRSGERDRRDISHWHLRKEVTWGHIISTLLMGGALIVAWVNIKTGIHENKQVNIFQDRQIEMYENQNERIRVEIRESVRDINIKIDRMIDLQLKRETLLNNTQTERANPLNQ